MIVVPDADVVGGFLDFAGLATTGFLATGGFVVVVVGLVVVGLVVTVVVVGDVVVVVGEVVVVVGVVAARHVGTVIALSSRVTAPVWARTLPLTFASVSRVIDVRAKIVPTKFVVVPNVAELPTVQNTLHAWAPPSRTMELLDAVVSDEPARKMKTASAFPPALRVTVPDTNSALAD
jgi:hypothetical protein